MCADSHPIGVYDGPCWCPECQAYRREYWREHPEEYQEFLSKGGAPCEP
jgi:hypothetical protein